MFKAARWRSDKNKIKAVFKLQFQATQVPQPEWDTLVVSLLPQDGGKPTTKSEEAVVQDGTCKWENPLHEIVKFTPDSKSGKLNEKAYNLLVSSGSSKGAALGEAAIDFAAYAESVKPSSVILRLKSSNSETFLHVTIQRIQSAADGRELESGDVPAQRHSRTLRSQLSNAEINGSSEETGMTPNGQQKYRSDGNADGVNDTNTTEVNSESYSALTYGKKMFQNADFRGILRGSSLDSGSEQNTPREIGPKSGQNHHDTVLLSSLSDNSIRHTLKEHHRSNTEWSVSSGPDASSDGSTNGSECMVLKDKLDDTDISIEKLKNDLVLLARQAENSELELQTLRKQIVKECKKSHDLFKEVSSLKDERDAYERECEQLKDSKHKKNNLKFDDKDPHFSLEVIREELDYEKELSNNLRVQLQKTQESNAELILAVKDLEELLEQKSTNKSSTVGANSDMTQSRAKIIGWESGSKHDIKEDEEQQALEELVRMHAVSKAEESLEQEVLSLSTEIEIVRKEKEELEMQMEQLALDYEILKQENHEISSKLQRIELQEQLKMHYESSPSVVIIDDLEEHVQVLQKEIETQAASFIFDIEEISRAKVEQEKRAIRAEEALRKVKWNNVNIAEKLQEEFMKLSAQMCSMFQENEKLAMQAQAEACELRARKCHLESLLENACEELERVKDLYGVNLKKVMHVLDLKDRKISDMTFEMQKISGQKDELLAEMEDMMRTLEEETKMLLKEGIKERKPLKELSEIKHFEHEEKGIVFRLRSQMENIRRQCIDLKHFLFEDKLEKENLGNEIIYLKHAVQKKEYTIAMIEKKLKGNSVRIAVSDGKIRKGLMKHKSNSPKRYKDMPGLKKRTKLLKEEIKLKADELENFEQAFTPKEDFSSGVSELKKEDSEKEAKRIPYPKLEDVPRTTEMELFNGAENLRVSGQCFETIDKEESAAFALKKKETDGIFSIRNPNDTIRFLSQIALLKQRNKHMETELKELRGRYSEISLKFAEVEGERQQLIMAVRNLKNTIKC